MSLIIKDGIGYGRHTQAVFYTGADTGGKKFKNPVEAPDFAISEWSPWGDNNDEPASIADDIENVPVLSAGVEGQARLAIGQSVDMYLLVNKDKYGEEDLEWIGDSQINDWVENNKPYQYSYQNVYNMMGYGWGATKFLLNGKRDYINRIKAADVHTCRMEKKDKYGVIKNLYQCGDWDNAPSKYDAAKMERIRLLEEDYELEELSSITSGYQFAMLHRILKNGRGYYPKPLHRSAKAWVAISRSIPAIKNAINTNQLTIKYIVLIAETYWERIHGDKWQKFSDKEKEDTINKKYDEINKFLAGEINSGKSIIAGKYYDRKSEAWVPDIEIQVIDDKMKDGKMLPDSAAADKQILFSMFSNPAIYGSNLLGDGASGGAGSGSDIREATLVLMNLLQPERTNNLAVLDLVKKYNGWSKRLEVERSIFAVTDTTKTNLIKKITPRLVWRYSAPVLTTLDKGGSTQPVTN